MHFNKISLQFLTDDYSRVAFSLPIPTYRKSVSKMNHQGYIVITYELKHSITSSNQFRWLANIKQSIKEHIKSEFEFIEYAESKNQDYINTKYTLKSLQEYFKAINTIYPKMYLPNNKEEVYQRLCIYASKLYYHKIFYLEMIIYSAIRMNKLLGEPYTYKELLNRSTRAYEFVNKNKPKEKLSDEKLKAALKIGGIKTGEKKKMLRQENQKRILELVSIRKYLKPSGKPNITAISKELSLSRETVSRIYSKSLLGFFPFFFFSYLFLMDYMNCYSTIYHNADSLSHTISTISVEKGVQSANKFKSVALIYADSLSHTF